MQHIENHDWVDVYGTVSEMRQYRCNMVQNEVRCVLPFYWVITYFTITSIHVSLMFVSSIFIIIIMVSVVMRQTLLPSLVYCSPYISILAILTEIKESSSSSCCRSRYDKDCFNHLTLFYLSLCCESDVHELIFMSLIFRFLLMVSLKRRRGRPLFL